MGRGPCPPEFRAEAMRPVRQGGVAIPDVARDLGCSTESVRNRVDQAERDEGVRADSVEHRRARGAGPPAPAGRGARAGAGDPEESKSWPLGAATEVHEIVAGPLVDVDTDWRFHARRKHDAGAPREPTTVAPSTHLRLVRHPSSRAATTTRQRREETMEVLFDRVAGLDVHRDAVTACVGAPRSSGRGRTSEVAEFVTTTGGLRQLRGWLAAAQVTHVAMEPTGMGSEPQRYRILRYGSGSRARCRARVGSRRGPPSRRSA